MRYFAIALLALILGGCGQRGALYFPGETSGPTPPPPQTSAETEDRDSDREDNDD